MSWLQNLQPKVVKKSKLGQAINYSLSNWELLTNVLLDGQCELDNNGAKASATIYSVVETAKMNNLNPYNYLKYLFEELPNTKLTSPEALDHLLPWSETLPEDCRRKPKTKE